MARVAGWVLNAQRQIGRFLGRCRRIWAVAHAGNFLVIKAGSTHLRARIAGARTFGFLGRLGRGKEQ